MNSKTPNLFDYATKELAQDAALAYILTWANPEFHESHRCLHRLGTALLRALLAKRNGETTVPTITSLCVKIQVDRIDLLALINDENQDGRVLLVEDKLHTDEHSNQIERYRKKAEKRYPKREIVPVYVKTGNVSQRRLPSKKECGLFLRRDLLDVLNQFPNTSDTIVDSFREHLQGWEDETNSYRHIPPSEWKRRAIEGFYSELEKRMEKKVKWSQPGWKEVHNRAGEVLCFTFAQSTISWNQNKVTMYLQIEDGTRLTVRLGEWSESGPGVEKQLMDEVLKRMEDSTRRAGDIKIIKAGRFRGGKSGAVAKVTFSDEKSYLARQNGDIVDRDATMQRLDRTREFVSKVANLYLD